MWRTGKRYFCKNKLEAKNKTTVSQQSVLRGRADQTAPAVSFDRCMGLAGTGSRVGRISSVSFKAFALLSPDILMKKNFHEVE